MTEKWTGQYFYGDEYPDNIKGTSVNFHIEWTIEDGIINGKCIDEESRHLFESSSTINGFIDDNLISFIKKYPHYWDIDENGNTRTFEDLPSPDIHYSGNYVEDHFEGEWEMSVTYHDEEGSTEQYDWTGTWTLYRI